MSLDRQEVLALVREGMSARSKKERRKRELGEPTMVIIGSVLGGWLMMLMVGIIHAQWIPQLPTVDYGTAFLVASLLRGALYVPQGARGSK